MSYLLPNTLLKQNLNYLLFLKHGEKGYVIKHTCIYVN